MSKVKIRYYAARPYSGGIYGYWQPTKAMREAGFKPVACGLDGPDAWKQAEDLNARWDSYRAADKARRWPIGSIGAAFEEFKLTYTWASKAPGTREDWERGWRYIGPIFGDIAPNNITLLHLDAWYRSIVRDKGVREGWRAVKIWRALWRVAAGCRYCKVDEDPSRALHCEIPETGQEIWFEGEVARLVKSAIRRGYHGLACVIAVAWDASLSPIDVRGLTSDQIEYEGKSILFRLELAKTGRAALGTLRPRASKLVLSYIEANPVDPSAPIFRNRSGRPYSKDTLTSDFRDIRGDDEKRTLADMRRSGAVEALAGGVTPGVLANKLANTVKMNEALKRNHFPVDKSVIDAVDQGRVYGRQRKRG